MRSLIVQHVKESGFLAGRGNSVVIPANVVFSEPDLKALARQIPVLGMGFYRGIRVIDQSKNPKTDFGWNMGRMIEAVLADAADECSRPYTRTLDYSGSLSRSLLFPKQIFYHDHVPESGVQDADPKKVYALFSIGGWHGSVIKNRDGSVVVAQPGDITLLDTETLHRSPRFDLHWKRTLLEVGFR